MISKFSKEKYKKGFSLVEILIGASIICLSLILIINLETGISKLGFGSTSRVQAGMLLEEGSAAVVNIRNNSWQSINSLNNNVPYRLHWNQASGLWEATSSNPAVLIDNTFDRTVTFYEVDRDINSFNIVSSGGMVDYGTRKYVVSVSWNDGSSTTTKTITSYIHNAFNK
ncbi:MAG: hypothetical protein WCO09_01060 [bacterium]